MVRRGPIAPSAGGTSSGRRRAQLESRPLRAPSPHRPIACPPSFLRSVAAPYRPGPGTSSGRQRARLGLHPSRANCPVCRRDLQRPATGATRVAPVAGQLPCPPSGPPAAGDGRDSSCTRRGPISSRARRGPIAISDGETSRFLRSVAGLGRSRGKLESRGPTRQGVR